MRKRWSLAAFAVILVGAFLVPHSAFGLGHHQAARAAKTEHILILSSNPSDKARAVVVAKGPVHALGTDIQGAHKDVFKFPKGSLTVAHKKTSGHNTADKKTCYFTHTEVGTYKITGGTGSYAGASGSGKYHLKVQFVACKNQKPRFVSIQISAAGPLTL